MAARLHARSTEICRAVLDRLHGMEAGSPARDIEYQRGLREAVSRGVDYSIALLEEGREEGLEVPMALVIQARLAARLKIPLDVVIQSYVAAKALLDNLILEESAALDKQRHEVLQAALATQGSAFDQLLVMVREEYKREELGRGESRESRLLGQIERLLAGELTDSSSLGYPLDRHHLGLVVRSSEARQVIRELAAATDARPLIVSVPGGEVWAWLGSDKDLDPNFICQLASAIFSPSVTLGLGEQGRSPAGWRLTHQQARAAFSVVQASPLQIARYADVAGIASAAQDPLLTASLRALYLSPLAEARDGGRPLREALRAYFSADRNSSSAASALGVSRQTMNNRLRQVEDCVGQPLSKCAVALDTALRLEELGLLGRY